MHMGVFSLPYHHWKVWCLKLVILGLKTWINFWEIQYLMSENVKSKPQILTYCWNQRKLAWKGKDKFRLFLITHRNCSTNPPSLSFTVSFLSFRLARCTRHPSEQFKTISTLSTLNTGNGGGAVSIFLRKKGVVQQYFVIDWLIV